MEDFTFFLPIAATRKSCALSPPQGKSCALALPQGKSCALSPLRVKAKAASQRRRKAKAVPYRSRKAKAVPYRRWVLRQKLRPSVAARQKLWPSTAAQANAAPQRRSVLSRFMAAAVSPMTAPCVFSTKHYERIVNQLIVIAPCLTAVGSRYRHENIHQHTPPPPVARG